MQYNHGTVLKGMFVEKFLVFRKEVPRFYTRNFTLEQSKVVLLKIPNFTLENVVPPGTF
jgi:hypothetical protein